MTGVEISIKFDGGDADKHQIEMKYYALALQGADEILSEGIGLLAFQRLPRPRERAPVKVKAREPIEGSVVTPTDVSEAWTALSFGLPILNAIGSDFLIELVKAVIARYSGNLPGSETSLDKMLQLNRDHLAARDRADERMLEERRMGHQERMLTLETLREAVTGLGPAAERLASPVGRTVRHAQISTGQGRTASIDELQADAIRENAKVTWDKIESVWLETDGFKFHTSGLSVRNPEGEGFMMATVKDPIFAEEENSYTEAAQKKGRVKVMARKGRKSGVLVRLEILELQDVDYDNLS